jgi:hypothetical protein
MRSAGDAEEASGDGKGLFGKRVKERRWRLADWSAAIVVVASEVAESWESFEMPSVLFADWPMHRLPLWLARVTGA